MITRDKEIILIGGGILGLSIARKFLIEGYKKITVFKKRRVSRNSSILKE